MPSGGKRQGAGRKPGHRERFTRELMREIALSSDMTAEMVRQELSHISGVDLADYYDEFGRFKPLKDIPPHARRCIASIKTTKKNLTAGDGVQEDVVEIKLWNKNQALELLGKYHALWVERKLVEHRFTLEDVIVGVVVSNEMSAPVTKSLPPAE